METFAFVPTRAASVNKNAEDSFKIVTYEAHKSKRRMKLNVDNEKESEDKSSEHVKDDRKGIDIKRARREIIKFGINGFDSAKKQEAKIALAISLGAKPPKNEFKNYKEMLQQKTAQKAKEKSEQALMQAGKNAVGVCISSKNFENKLKNKERVKTNKDLLSGYGKATLQNNKIQKNDFRKGNQRNFKKGNNKSFKKGTDKNFKHGK